MLPMLPTPNVQIGGGGSSAAPASAEQVKHNCPPCDRKSAKMSRPVGCPKCADAGYKRGGKVKRRYKCGGVVKSRGNGRAKRHKSTKMY